MSAFTAVRCLIFSFTVLRLCEGFQRTNGNEWPRMASHTYPDFSQIPLYLSWIKQIAVIYALDSAHISGPLRLGV